MNKNLTEVVFILDMSGSMYGLEADTIGGFNGLIEKQKKEEGDAVITTVVFNDKSETIYDRISVDKVEPMTDREYSPCGCTALLDAVGETVKNISMIQKHLREEDKPAKTMVVITTDGYENSSKKYSYSDIRKLISKQKKAGWEFLFLGANIDAEGMAESVGIDRKRAVNYKCDDVGTRKNFEALSTVMSRVRGCKEERMVEACFENWDASIREHNK